MKKAFTLIEILITTCILAVLFVLIFRTYNDISKITTKIDSEKNLYNEVLFLTQTVQNFWDYHNLNYSGYSNDLIDNNWFVDILHFSWDEIWSVGIYLTWDNPDSCIFNDFDEIKQKKCWVEMNKNWNRIQLTNPNTTYINNLKFKIIPYEDLDKYNLNYENIYGKWFWMFFQWYSKIYNPNYYFYNVNINYQTFFNIKI